MMIGNKVEYIQAYTEINCLLKYFPKEYINELPNKLLNMIKNKSDEKYNIDVDINKGLQNQNISKKTKDILVVLKYNYWSNESEKEYFKKQFYENEKKFQEELSIKYNPDNIFKKYNEEKIFDNTNEENFAMIEYKETIFKRILNKIKKFLNR